MTRHTSPTFIWSIVTIVAGRLRETAGETVLDLVFSDMAQRSGETIVTPAGYATTTPYFFMENADAFCAFLVEGLGGEEVGRHLNEDGKIANARVRLGDFIVMVSEAGRGFPAMPASYYLFVENADNAVARAIAAGATMIMAVADMPYGDRQGGVRDPHGNLWWISQRLIAGGYD